MQVESIAESAILSTFIKLPFVIKAFVLSGRFTQVLLKYGIFLTLNFAPDDMHVPAILNLAVIYTP